MTAGGSVDLGIAAAVFPVIFIGELPDKTMFASLVMSSRGRPLAVWLGAAGAFLVHVAIATTVGVGLFALLPHRALEGVVAALFAAGALYAYVEGNRDEATRVTHEAVTPRRVVVTAFVVIFLAEWGDLTQILTANLAAHYHAPLSVGLGALLALWCVAGLAVVSGQSLLRIFPIRAVRRFTAVVLLVLAGVAAASAISG
jgi:putative Ca2+/H+ antiporter (TMEM165/GDT1 family)